MFLLVPTGVWVPKLGVYGVGGEMEPASSFGFLHQIPALSAHVLRLENKSSYTTQIQMAFQTSASTAHLCGAIGYTTSLRVGTQFLISSPRAKPYFVNYPELSPVGCTDSGS